MGYTPHTWTVGDVITAERLNALEQGVASGGGGYDLVLKCDNTDDIYEGTVTLESGTFAAAYAKGMSGEPLSIRAYADNGDTEGERLVMQMPVLQWVVSEIDEMITLSVGTTVADSSLEGGDILTFLPFVCAWVNITANGITVVNPWD